MKAPGAWGSNQDVRISGGIWLRPKSRQGLTTNAGKHSGVAHFQTGDQILPCKHVNECCDLWVSASHG